MKKVFYITMILLASIASKSIAQSYTLYMMGGETPEFEGYLTCDSLTKWAQATGVTAPIQTIANWGDGNIDTFNMTIYGTSASVPVSHGYTVSGSYTAYFELRGVDGTLFDTHTEYYDINCKSIRGFIYKKNDANCAYDEGVDGLDYSLKQIEIKKSGVIIDTYSTYSSGYFIEFPSPVFGEEYELTLLDNGMGLVQECGPYKFMFDTITADNNRKDIGFSCGGTAVFDNRVLMGGWFRAVDTSIIHLYAFHSSCVGTGDATVTLQLSPKYSFVSATITPTTISSGTLTWDLNDFSTEYIYIKLIPVGTLTLGDTTEFIANIDPISGDFDTDNNEYILNQEIVAAYDPNNKIANPAQVFTSGETLDYIINFENLGTDTAFNIYIMDTLSSNVIPETFTLLNSSHNVNVIHFEYAGKHIVKFDFPRIKLPHAIHPEANKGFVMYQIKTKDGLSIGSEVENTAHIYFDVNPAIVTNTTVNVIPEPSSIPQLPLEFEVSVHPNPSNGLLNIQVQNHSFEQVALVNNLGQILETKNIKEGNNTWNIQHLSAGMYYLVFQLEGKMYTYKIVKQ